MARGINKVILIGNLGADPEVRSLPSGQQMATLSLATHDSWRDKQSGEQRDRTEWHRVVLWGALADIAHKYLKKGNQVYIEGRIQTRKWQDKQSGQDRYSTEIVGNDMQMLGGRGTGADMGAGRGGESGSSEDYASGSSYGSANASSYASASGGSVSSHSGGGGASETTRESFDDEIPF